MTRDLYELAMAATMLAVEQITDCADVFERAGQGCVATSLRIRASWLEDRIAAPTPEIVRHAAAATAYASAIRRVMPAALRADTR